MLFRSVDIIDKLGLTINPNKSASVTLADASNTEALGTVKINVTIKGSPNSISRQEFYVLNRCPKNILLGLPFCKAFSSIKLPFGGKLPPLNVNPNYSRKKERASCSFSSTLKVEAPMLFKHLVDPNLPIKQNAKKYSVEEKNFIAAEVDRLLKHGLIRKSHRCWRRSEEHTSELQSQ